MGKKPNVVTAILIAVGFLFINLVAVGCSSSPIRGYNKSSSDDRVTLSPDTKWKRWQKPNGDLIKSKIIDQNLDSAVGVALYSPEEGPLHGLRGIYVSQVQPGELLIEVEPSAKDRPVFQGQCFGNTVLDRLIRRDVWGTLGEMSVVSGTANVLTNKDDPNTRATLFLFLARNQDDYAAYAKYAEGAPETLAEYLAMYPDRVVVETLMAPLADPATAAAPAPAGGTLKR